MVPHLIIYFFFHRVLVSDIHWVKAGLLNNSLNDWIFGLSPFFIRVHEHLVALNRDENLVFLKQI